ncbi:MAG: hypothetical protein UZ21_OP11001000764 [Microgenomates bacterium OLB22]|nr:MAG: hypothetical protein UZ21_OP11001000764 [Microgenomates bacterium OLB22]
MFSKNLATAKYEFLITIVSSLVGIYIAVVLGIPEQHFGKLVFVLLSARLTQMLFGYFWQRYRGRANS